MLETTSPDGQTRETERGTDLGGPASHVPETHDDYVEPSLGDDLTALVDDGKAYVEAELAFQKSRAAFVAHEIKAGAGFALVMLAFLHLALMGIVVGLIIALAPIFGAFGATAIMGGALLAMTGLFGWLAARRFRKISAAFENDDDSQSETGTSS